MVYKVLTYSLVGIEAFLVEVESDVSLGLPAFNIVGLPENTIKESKERIRAAIKNSKLPFPEHRITINLAPADLKKEGTSFDLPIAVSILAHSLNIPKEHFTSFLISGELSLTGEIKTTKGALSSAFLSKKLKLKGLLMPPQNALEVARFIDIPVYPVKHILDVVSFFKGDIQIKPFLYDKDEINSALTNFNVDFSEVSGQYQAKRALEIAAAGKHNVLMFGPPGSGKSMMAVRLPTILPDMTLEEALETTMIYSCAGLLEGGKPITTRPFRSPHHTSSEVSIVGGGTVPRPGEISLAHNGILFLDEFPEFKRPVIEALRQPLEEGLIHVSRANSSVTFPADFMLVAAMNPCFCGFYGDSGRQCSCSYAQVIKYRKKISGPILDRIDIHIEVPRIPVYEFSKTTLPETSANIRARVLQARQIQNERFKKNNFFNSRLTSAMIKKFCQLTQEARSLLDTAAESFKLSARSYNKILKLARTIADLDSSYEIKSPHISEAIHLRGMDKEIS